MTYRELVEHTMNHALSSKEQITNASLGLCGESGEVADLIKKHLFQGHPLDTDKVIKEIGDIRWYLELLCITLGVTISEVEKQNINKLLLRYPNGFSVTASTNRTE